MGDTNALVWIGIFFEREELGGEGEVGGRGGWVAAVV
jgi:hypothetical protein